MKKAISIVMLYVLLFSTSSFFVLEASAIDGVVITPNIIEETLYPGRTEHDTITVELPPSIPKARAHFHKF